MVLSCVNQHHTKALLSDKNTICPHRHQKEKRLKMIWVVQCRKIIKNSLATRAKHRTTFSPHKKKPIKTQVNSAVSRTNSTTYSHDSRPPQRNALELNCRAYEYYQQ